MSCIFGGKNKANLLNIEITPCICDLKGSVKIHSEHHVHNVQWKEEATGQSLTCTEDNGLTAKEMNEGHYLVNMLLCNKPHSVRINVPFVKLPLVEHYDVTHASSDYARDGKVEARVKYMPSNCTYLWTSGVVTKTPVLEDVQAGLYTICPVDTSARAISHLHNCTVAEVKTSGTQKRSSIDT